MFQGQYYWALRDRPTVVMTNVDVVRKPNHRGFMSTFVVGQTPQGEVSIQLSAKDARAVKIGGEYYCVQTSEKPVDYMPKEILDMHLGQVFFSLWGVPFNFMAVLGGVITMVSIGWGTYGLVAPEN